MIDGDLRRLIELLAQRSATGMEAQLMEALESELRELGLEVIRQPLEGDLNGRYNLIALRGKPAVLIATHVDTVPTWEHVAGGGYILRGDELILRGAVDTKGQILGLLLALRRTDAPVAIALFADEERDGRGSETFSVRAMEDMIDLRDVMGALVLEPSELRVATAQWGNLELEIWMGGAQAHGASLEGENALLKLIDLIGELRKLAGELGLYLHVGRLEGGIDPQVVPDRAYCVVDLLVPNASVERIAYEELVRRVLELVSSAGGEWRVLSADPPFRGGDELRPLLEVIGQAYEDLGLRMELVEYTAWTDAQHLYEMGVPTVILGVGRLSVAHTRTESVSLEEVNRLADLLARILERGSLSRHGN